MYPEQRLLKLEARKEYYDDDIIWYLKRFILSPDIPENEFDYYTEKLLHVQRELRNAKTEQDIDTIVNNFIYIKEELKKKYENVFKR